MLRRTYFLALSLLLGPVIGFAGETPDHSPAFTAIPALTAGFDLLYEQKFAKAMIPVKASQALAAKIEGYEVVELLPTSG